MCVLFTTVNLHIFPALSPTLLICFPAACVPEKHPVPVTAHLSKVMLQYCERGYGQVLLNPPLSISPNSISLPSLTLQDPRKALITDYFPTYYITHSSSTQMFDVDGVYMSKVEEDCSRAIGSMVKSDFCGMIHATQIIDHRQHLTAFFVIRWGPSTQVCLLMCCMNFTMGWKQHLRNVCLSPMRVKVQFPTAQQINP